MIQDIKNVEFTLDDRVVISKNNIDGDVLDWKTDNGSFQVILVNPNFKYGLKIPNRNHGDSFKLMRCSGVSTWGRPKDEARPIKKYTSHQFKALYSLLQFHYENGFGPELGRIIDININGETYFAFEQERLEVSDTYCAHLQQLHETPDGDEDALNTVIYNDLTKPNGFLEMYEPHNALKDNRHNHVIAPKMEGQTYTIGYKADCSIFFMKDGHPKCFDVDYNTIQCYFNETFINGLVEKYSDLIEERNFSDYL